MLVSLFSSMELCDSDKGADKKLLVTSLQQVHNWTARHDRNKMSFWLDVIYDEEATLATPVDEFDDSSKFHNALARSQVQHWLDRNSRLCDTARDLLTQYANTIGTSPPGPLTVVRPLAWNWFPKGSFFSWQVEQENDATVKPEWREDETDAYERDKSYGRVSHEIDTWWVRVRDQNYHGIVVPMPTVEAARQRIQHCILNMPPHYPQIQREEPPEAGVEGDSSQLPADDDNDLETQDGEDYVDDLFEDDEPEDDDDSYGDGPLTGLLTEVPNILDPKQIEALHMTVKSCILDMAGTGLTRAGENLQRTRCKMLLATDSGKSLLREILVFIAVWEKDEKSDIFKLSTHIIEAVYHSALIPYAWNSLRIPKDIMSPAQTVLLRLVNHMFRARLSGPPPKEEEKAEVDTNGKDRDANLVHFFFNFFRTRLVPECVALMHLQTDIQEGKVDESEFPVDTWDMERGRDGLAQFLDFLTCAAEVVELRKMLIEWEAVYDLITIIDGLEYSVPKKSLVDSMPKRGPRPPSPPPTTAKAAGQQPTTPSTERPHATSPPLPPPHPARGIPQSPISPPPALHEPPHKYTWPGIKGQILTIIATLLQPPQGKTTPGNPDVQMQMVKHSGILPLLTCCAYDDNNPFAKERVTICLKWLLDGCEPANRIFRDLMNYGQRSGQGSAGGAGGVSAAAGLSSARENQGNGKVETSLPVREKSTAGGGT